jgi:5-methylcytosine-specific restriction endonuclease McrA
MAKLSNLRPTLKSLAPRIAYTQNPEAAEQRTSAPAPWESWKKTYRWQQLRASILLRDQYQCQWPGCGRIHSDTSQLVADHRQPHRGDKKLFWDPTNLQTLCASPCHNKHKQRMEASMPKGVWY